MRFGVFTSLLLHVAAIGAAFLSLPPNWRPDVQSERYIPLELIREAELDLTTSVPAARPEPEPVETPEPELPEPELPEPEIETPPEPPAPVEQTPPALAEEPEPSEVQVVPEQPKKVPSVKPKKQDEDLDLDALSKLIDKMQDEEGQERPRNAPSETIETADKPRSAIGAGDRLTASENALMNAAIGRCWRASAIIGAPEPEKLRVVLLLELNPDGTLIGSPRVENALQISLSGNRFWKVAEQTALRATIECQPYDFLDPARYELWREMRLNFDPSQMVGL